MSDVWQDLGQRGRPSWFIRNGMWLMLLWTCTLFVVAASLPFGNIVTAPVRFRSPTVASGTVPRNVAETIHPPQQVTVLVGEREIAATITEMLPPDGDRASLRLRTAQPVPAQASGTVSIRLPRSPLLSQLLGSAIPK